MNIVITGATKGIGKAIAVKFAQKGFNLALCARTSEDLEVLKKELAELNASIEILIRATDLSKKNEAIDFATFIKSRWQRIDVLVNNTGVFSPGEIHKEEDGTLENTIETNLYSAYHLTRALLPAMLAHNSGHIFNMCSVASLYAYPNGGSYSISKFALLGFSKVLREELKDKGIKVTALIPGATWTESWAGSGVSPSRMMEAEDIASAVWGAYVMGPSAVVEEIILRPQLGDL